MRGSRFPATSLISRSPTARAASSCSRRRRRASRSPTRAGWPAIEAIDADVRIDGSRLTIDAARGRVHGVDIGRTRVEIPDMAAQPAILRVDGEAAGPVEAFVRYVNDTPLAARIGPLNRDAEALGAGRLALKIGLPLGHPEDVKVVGDFAFTESQLRIAGVPLCREAQRQAHVHRAGCPRARCRGGNPRRTVEARRDRRSADQTRVTGTGTFGLAALRREYAQRVSRSRVRQHRLVDERQRPRLGHAGMGVRKQPEGSERRFAGADRQGRGRRDAVAHRRARRDRPAGNRLSFSPATVAWRSSRRIGRGRGRRDDRRALLSLGRSIERPDAARAERPGLWIRGELPALNVDDWIALLPQGAANESGRPNPGCLSRAPISTCSNSMRWERDSPISSCAMREAPQGWAFDIDGPEIAGTANWSAPGGGAPNGRIMARLSRITVPGRGSAAPGAAPKPRRTPLTRRPRPRRPIRGPRSTSRQTRCFRRSAISAGSSSSRSRGAPIGESTSWCSRTTPDGSKPTARGASPGRAQQTKLDVVLDAPDSGAFLARYGYAEGVKGAATRIDGQLAWTGAPHEFDFSSLNGHVPHPRRPRTIHEARAGSGQAPRRAVAAGAAAARDARLQRRLQRRIRVRRDHRQRAHRQRRHDARPI